VVNKAVHKSLKNYLEKAQPVGKQRLFVCQQEGEQGDHDPGGK
jgi:hypothetical protein